MQLKLETTGITFTVGSEPEPVQEYDNGRPTGRPKADEHGQPLYSVQLVAFYTDRGRSRSEIITVKLADPAPIPPGTPVRVHELVAQPWANNGRSGIAYRAARIEPLDRPAKAAS